MRNSIPNTPNDKKEELSNNTKLHASLVIAFIATVYLAMFVKMLFL
ncbi:hypothetical protein KK062_04310 [Fulvivirgaceae bacterium PWU5]|uniref:Uncharacterized protein n=1 Tax=Dawidia cretensis TaxID=2782350 RepID=A0AAP2GSQ1_9BACT|nr:hypothetical protein [Dawidia cretensis]MBT1707428.1 hypothetical protein [Dawidia cretensis]